MKQLLIFSGLLLGLLSSVSYAEDKDIWLCHDEHGNKYYENNKINPKKCKKVNLPPISSVHPDASTKKHLPISVGMTQEQVLANWGKPKDIHRVYSKTSIDEQWAYPKGNLLYFVNGVLQVIQD
jgi:hypothetical protein